MKLTESDGIYWRIVVDLPGRYPREGEWSAGPSSMGGYRRSVKKELSDRRK